MQSIADLLRTFFRGVDVVCRCDGEEFAVILRESLPHDAATRADQFRAGVEGHKLKYSETRLGPLSISVVSRRFLRIPPLLRDY
jgi:diguanylate cyclase (GGDEF)-like protein